MASLPDDSSVAPAALALPPMVTHVVWDWNGTLLDDLDCCLDVTDQLLTEFNLPPLGGRDRYQRIFRFPVADYYADLGFDTGVDRNFDAAARRYVQLYTAAAASCRLHEGAREALEALRNSGVQQVIISASQQQVLEAQLAPFALGRWLDGAYGIADIYAASKLGVAERWLLNKGIDPLGVVFVGDSAHDHEIATALGAQCVLFSRGHHAGPHLRRLGPPVIDDLRDLLAFVAPAAGRHDAVDQSR